MKVVKLVRKDNCCNICKNIQDSFLSWDHVPPKGGLDLSAMDIRNYSERYYNSKSNKGAHSQNGLKFRTLCKSCNSLLGSRYDDCFNTLMKDVNHIITTKLTLPQKITIETYPTKIIKALLGHLLASKTEHCDSQLDIITRKYLFNDEAILDPDVNVYYWLYPYNCTIIQNDIIQMDISRNIKYYSVLKSFPLGFAISYQCELDKNKFVDLTKYNDNNVNKKNAIPLFLNREVEYDYPEDLRYSGIQLVPKESNDIIAIKKT